MNLDDFYIWLQKSEPEIEHIHALLSKLLNDEPEALIGDLEEAEAWNSRAGFLLAEANSFLDQAKRHFLPTKEGNTDFDRRILLDEACSLVRLNRDKIESLCDSLKQRLILGESILGYLRMFKENRAIEQKKAPY